MCYTKSSESVPKTNNSTSGNGSMSFNIYNFYPLDTCDILLGSSSPQLKMCPTTYPSRNAGKCPQRQPYHHSRPGRVDFLPWLASGFEILCSTTVRAGVEYCERNGITFSSWDPVGFQSKMKVEIHREGSSSPAT